MMQNKVIVYSLVVLMGSTHAMEKKDWQKAPGQQLGGSGQQSSLIPPTRRPSSPPIRPLAPPASAAPAAGLATETDMQATAQRITRPATAAALAQEEAEKEHKGLSDRGHRRQKLQEYIRTRLTASAEEVYIASYDSESLPFIVSRRAASLSPMLQNYLMDQERRIPGEGPLLILDNSAEQIHFIAEVLSFLAPIYEPLLVLQKRLEQEKIAEKSTLIEQDIEKQKQIAEKRASIEQDIEKQKKEIINQVAENIVPIVALAGISFAEAIELAHFFDLPIIFDALVHIPQPMPLPQTVDEIKQYNNQLVALFTIAQSTPDNRLWQLLGRMLYPGCLLYPEIAQIVAHIPHELQHSILGTYMQMHPQLYEHIMHTINNTDYARFSPDGQIIAVRQYPNLTLIDVKTGAILHTFNNAICDGFSPNGQIIVVQQYPNTILIDVKTGAITHTINNTDYAHFSPDGQIIAVRQGDNTILIDLKTGAILHTINNAHHSKFSPNGQTITAIQDKILTLINTTTGNIVHTFNNADNPCFSPDGQTIAANQGRDAILINSATGAIIHTINNTSFPVFSPNGQIIVARQDRNVILINSATGAIIHTFNNAEFPHFSPDGRILITQPVPPTSLNIRGYATLQEALQAPIVTASSAVAPDGSSASPAATHRAATEPEEEVVILADPRFDQMERPATSAQEQQPAVAVVELPPAHVTPPAPVVPATEAGAPAPQPAPRRGFLGAISNWWYGKKQ